MDKKDKQLSLFNEYNPRKEGWNDAINKVIEISEVYDLFGLTISEIKDKLNDLKKD